MINFLLGMTAGAALVLAVLIIQSFLIDHHKGETK